MQQNFGFLSVPPPPEDQLEVITLQQDSQEPEGGLTEPQEAAISTAQQPSTSTSTSSNKSAKQKLQKLLFWQRKAAQISAGENIDSNFTIGDSDDNESV